MSSPKATRQIFLSLDAADEAKLSHLAISTGLARTDLLRILIRRAHVDQDRLPIAVLADTR